MDWTHFGAAVAFIVPVFGTVKAWGSLQQRMSDHEDHDTDRFNEIRELLKENRLDIKELLKQTHDRNV